MFRRVFLLAENGLGFPVVALAIRDEGVSAHLDGCVKMSGLWSGFEKGRVGIRWVQKLLRLSMLDDQPVLAENNTFVQSANKRERNNSDCYCFLLFSLSVLCGGRLFLDSTKAIVI